MGKILQIRVGAWTYNEDEVVAAWPRLSALVWSELDRWGPAGMKRGVTELAEYLPDALRFADISEESRKTLMPGAKKVTDKLNEMRSALADWDPRKANALSDELEDALTELEKQAPEDFLALADGK
ncbi:hypothetical protein [uncultured Mailhella sp.]|uniref:hypothetical protein n=1 Tax=uncultured Mailhella sp. TaxID=1981031 RepID=UPI0025FDDFFB|nr:hypothetical protein [uncultured Mailhella sp.]